MMDEGKYKSMKMVSGLVFFLGLILSITTLSCCSAAANQELGRRKKPLDLKKIGSSVLLPVRGSVYPHGCYNVELKIGLPPKPYYLDIDTGSDLTWLQCDAPCKSCTKTPHPLYRPNKNGLIPCKDPLCAAIHSSSRCAKPDGICQYVIEYADEGSSEGFLVNETFPFRFINRSTLFPRMGLGCGYNQKGSSNNACPTDGVLGLGKGKVTIVSQLQSLGLIQNVIGHCFDSRGGGYLFLGGDLVPKSGVVWAPMSRDRAIDNHYSPGKAEITLGKQSIGVKALDVIFDSGSSYTYFNIQTYNAFISSLVKDLSGAPLKIASDTTLPICLKGAKPFKSITDVKKYFKPVLLNFVNSKKEQMEIPPESYLILSEFGNACLGILNGTEVEMHYHLIGDNFFQDKWVIYDNEKQRIGWAAGNCKKLLNVDDDDKGLPHTPNLTEEYLPGNYTSEDDIYEEL